MLYRALGELPGTVRTGVLVLAGPTASGKTQLAIDLAQQFNAEIVSADSRQIYRGMEIGTAAPTHAQREKIRHHLVSFLDPHERYSAARFAEDATSAVLEIHTRGKRAIVAGGTGFYIRALTGGVELDAAYDPDLRARLAREATLHDAQFLHGWLAMRDPRRAQMLQPTDTYRVLRALEVALAPKRATHRDGEMQTLASQGIPFAKIFLDIDDVVLLRRIEARTDRMLADGFFEEAQRVGASAVAADAVGYPQVFAYLQGRCTFEELRATLVRATRRYAKRQQSWFRREPNTLWLRAADVASAAREKLGWV